ncbi:hypothetical protein BOTBODRAFT_134671 [Botryobasidium botryosum FD-172 SS1]|uniref:Uncharacterized protein n=1 Tax=Botryobasidium botryosum (strain FD-172 SS1) TaxID=930990 RepID=A0A067MLQ2_BOTB1|nr:hypothetical protein BOTBODRAFT_134671 [Botryobasidium botryosum FD-172 SS1]
MSASSARAKQLLELVDIVTSAAKTVITEWEKEDANPITDESIEAKMSPRLPTFELYNARKTIIAAAGSFIELAVEPQSRLLEVGAAYFESRALHIAAEHRVADLLAKADPNEGLSAKEISQVIGIHPQKLARIMRTLCSIHIFAEVQHNRFSNNTVSAALVGNEPLRAYIIMFSLDIYHASNYLPKTLRDPVKGQLFDVDQTAFQEAVGTKLPRWEWLEEQVPQADGTLGPRPELKIFGLAMLGGGRVYGPPLIHDFPWASLGSKTVVDVGGGVGGLSLGLAKTYPDLKFVVQDRASVLVQGKEVWEREMPEALNTRVTLMPHNFFNENPVKGAAVYFMRYIIHDWEDDRCVDILSAIRPCLGPDSCILIADQVMNTTLGCPELEPAPKPLPANYGYEMRFSHARDLAMMSIINGRERTPEMTRELAARSGLEVTKIWESRGCVAFTELRLPRA